MSARQVLEKEMPAAGVEPNDKTLAELKQLGFVKRIARKGGHVEIQFS